MRRIPIVVALVIGTFLSSLDVTLVSTAMPRIISELHGIEFYGWVFSTYLLTSTAMVPIYGKLADLLGRRTPYFIGLSVFLVGSLLCAAATSMRMLIVARAVQGIGAGALFPITMTIVGDLFNVAERSRVQGVLALVWGVSSIIGPAVGGAFVTYWTWRWGFWINLPIGVATAIMLAIFYREKVGRVAQSSRPRIDVAGAVLVVATLVMLLVAVGRSHIDWRMLGAGAVLLVLFVWVEQRAAEPVVPPTLFRDGVVVLSCATNLMLGAVLFAYIAYVTLYLQGVVGLSPVRAGLLAAPVSLTWPPAAFFVGRWILAYGYRRVLRTSSVLVFVAATCTFSATTPDLSSGAALALFEAGQLLLGAGMGLGTSALVIVVQDRVPWSRRGAATATLQLTRQMGATFGTAVLGALVAGFLRHRLAAIPGAPSPEALLDPEQWKMLGAAMLETSRGALGASLRQITMIVLVIGGGAGVATWLFPDVRAGRVDGDTPSDDTSPLTEGI
ncbi:MAG TPA: MDR family MFS transporter [Polyangia bacterium]|nr:MDR family MFS transporter [Polyangia bacterium]